MWLEWEALVTFNFCDQFRCMGSRCTIAHEEAFSLFFSFFFFHFHKLLFLYDLQIFNGAHGEYFQLW